MLKQIDNDFLLELFRIPSMSTKEDRMKSYVEKRLTRMNIPFETDDYGNIYNITNKDMPMLNAHMDTVQDEDDVELASFIKIRENVLSGYGVIGGDDKCGIYVIFKLLEEIPTLNFLFTVEEELGCVGSGYFVKNQKNNKELDNVLYCLTLDRKGNEDILCVNNSYGSKEFQEVLHDAGKEFNYSPSTGTMCDADKLNDFFSCCNLSSSYYNAHTKDEFVLLDGLQQTYEYVHKIVTTVKEKFPLAKKETYGYSGYDYTGYGDYSGQEYDSSYHNYNGYNGHNYNGHEGYDTFDEDYYDIYGIHKDDSSESKRYSCLVTDEDIMYEKGSFYLKNLKRTISKRGLEILLKDLLEAGALEPDALRDDFEEIEDTDDIDDIDDIDEYIKGFK